MFYSRFSSPFGEILITANEQGVSSLTFVNGKKKAIVPESYVERPEVFSEAHQQLNEYFCGKRFSFSLPLAAQGTPFQQKVWQALQTIPCGQTRSYAWIAKEIGNAKAVRAVGTANGANPIALIVPCHRVIGADGKLTGYAGGLALKAKLLMHEGANFKP
ncbi:methylated-DNA--[protein]-cysteine S-methyltransferase [Thalassotalea sp. PLHSN55]|uniref:methylated-DNA--[protein]-cysteine S-methyltransferase n=1 Tax=Thalassotalea sp. PLHSN55 TaxID=3435888 RepID=UPI003F848E0D